jgi:hypothetical protein
MIADRQHPRPARWLVPAIYCGSLVVFTLDMTVVNTLPFGVFYVPLVATALYRRENCAVWILTAMACAMVFIGSFSPSIDPDTFDLAVNRTLSIGAVLGTATLVYYRRPIEQPFDDGSPLAILWERSGGVYYATFLDVAGEVSQFLVAEPAGVGWRWTAWRRGAPQLQVHRGLTLTVQQAMREAERAAGKRLQRKNFDGPPQAR